METHALISDLVSDLDIYRAAQVMVKRYGEDAPLEAATRGDEFLDKGDLDGQRVWLRILRAVNVLLDDTPKGPLN